MNTSAAVIGGGAAVNVVIYDEYAIIFVF